MTRFSPLHPFPLHPAIAMMHGGTLNLPCGTVVSARIGTVNRNELWDTGADKGHFARSTPPFARGADLSGNRYVVHRNPLALSRPQRPAGSSHLWEETIPAPRFRRGDWYARRENTVRGRKDARAQCTLGSRLHDLCRLQSDDYQSSGGSATNVFNCARLYQIRPIGGKCTARTSRPTQPRPSPFGIPAAKGDTHTPPQNDSGISIISDVPYTRRYMSRSERPR